MQGRKKCSVSAATRGSISILEESTEKLFRTLLTCYRQVLSRPRWHDRLVGNTEQESIEQGSMNGASRSKWSGESQAWSQALVPSESHKQETEDGPEKS